MKDEDICAGTLWKFGNGSTIEVISREGSIVKYKYVHDFNQDNKFAIRTPVEEFIKLVTGKVEIKFGDFQVGQSWLLKGSSVIANIARIDNVLGGSTRKIGYTIYGSNRVDWVHPWELDRVFDHQYFFSEPEPERLELPKIGSRWKFPSVETVYEVVAIDEDSIGYKWDGNDRTFHAWSDIMEWSGFVPVPTEIPEPIIDSVVIQLFPLDSRHGYADMHVEGYRSIMRRGDPNLVPHSQSIGVIEVPLDWANAKWRVEPK